MPINVTVALVALLGAGLGGFAYVWVTSPPRKRQEIAEEPSAEFDNELLLFFKGEAVVDQPTAPRPTIVRQPDARGKRLAGFGA